MWLGETINSTLFECGDSIQLKSRVVTTTLNQASLFHISAFFLCRYLMVGLLIISITKNKTLTLKVSLSLWFAAAGRPCISCAALTIFHHISHLWRPTCPADITFISWAFYLGKENGGRWVNISCGATADTMALLLCVHQDEPKEVVTHGLCGISAVTHADHATQIQTTVKPQPYNCHTFEQCDRCFYFIGHK